jgi:hypothetical protein
MLEIVTHGPNAHELRRDGVRVAVVDDIADAWKLAAVDELVKADKDAYMFLSSLWKLFDATGRLPDGFRFNLGAVDYIVEYLRRAVAHAEGK